jgi:hypothetical protein
MLSLLQIAIRRGALFLFRTAIESDRGSSDGNDSDGNRNGKNPERSRHRDKSGRIERKHGNTKVATLRKEYNPAFAKGRRKDMMLNTLLAETGSTSLHDCLKHHHK